MSEIKNGASPEFKEKDLKPRILEIGVGFKPYYECLKSGIPEDVNFVGIDIQKDWLKELKEKHPNISLVNTNAQVLPFKDQAFDEVVLNSVLGGPDQNWYIQPYGKRPSGHRDRKWDIQMEAFRVLKVGGRLKIFEMHPLVDGSGLYNNLQYLDDQKDLFRKISAKDDKDLQAFGKMRDKDPEALAIVFEKLKHQATS